jgi:hypothetical protein
VKEETTWQYNTVAKWIIEKGVAELNWIDMTQDMMIQWCASLIMDMIL